MAQPAGESNPAANDDGLGDPLIVTGRVTIDEMLEKHCGEFGPWQRSQFFLANLAWALEGFHGMVLIFADHVPDFRCIGSGGGCYEGADSVCGFDPGSWEWVGGSSSSTVAQWGLVCGERFKVGLVQAAFFAGCMIGAGILGHLSDSSLGRKGTLIVVCAINGIFGCLTALAPTYWIYLILRILTGFSTGGLPICTFALANEAVGPNKRGATGVSSFYFFSSGIVMLSFVAYLTQHSWRLLYVASSVPSLLFLFLVLPFVSESPRWYLVRGKVEEATKIMHKIAESSGRKIPDDVVLARDEQVNNSTTEEEAQQGDGKAAEGSLTDVVRWSVTRTRLILLVLNSIFCGVAYTGLNLNVVNLGTNIYINLAVNAVSELPAFACTALLIDRVGRKLLGIGTMCFSGVFCLLGSLVVGDGAWKIVRMICSVLGVFGVAGTYNLQFIYFAELFPTVVRSAVLGCSAQATQLAAIVAPFVVVLGGSMPLAIFAGCGFAGALMFFFLPDTMNQPMYDTIEGMMEAERVSDDGVHVA